MCPVPAPKCLYLYLLYKVIQASANLFLILLILKQNFCLMAADTQGRMHEKKEMPFSLLSPTKLKLYCMQLSGNEHLNM